MYFTDTPHIFPDNGGEIVFESLGRDNLEKPDLDGRIILKCILNK
jgi:hypothetical protein